MIRNREALCICLLIALGYWFSPHFVHSTVKAEGRYQYATETIDQGPAGRRKPLQA
jgi:hypothetical protein